MDISLYLNENSWLWVHKVKRLCFPSYMALCISIHLRQRTSRIYQDHPHFCRILTSFVPPVHNQGVSLAPLQGLALWKIFLPTTGSFFVLSLTDLFCMFLKPVPFGRRFPSLFLIPFCFPATAEFNSQNCFLKAQFSCSRNATSFISGCYAASIYDLLMSLISSPHHNLHLL